VVGVRNCKWLSELSIKDYESTGDWTKNNYKMYPPWMTKPGPGVDAAFDTSVQSAITEVTRTAPNAATVKGWTFCGGGRGVQRVELSTDAGKSFSSAARIDPGFNQAPGRKWAWQAWSADVTLPAAPEGSKTVVCSRAISSTNDVQPNVPEYNFRGLFFNGYSCKEVPR
jgi:sulfite oxidase